MKIKATIKDQQDLRVRTSTFTVVRLQDFSDINSVNLEDGSVLVYNSNLKVWETTRTLEKQIMNAGFF